MTSPNIKHLISRMDQLDVPIEPQPVISEDLDNPLLAEWQQFKEQTTNLTKPQTPQTVNPNPQVTSAMARLGRTVPGMPPAARVSRAVSAAAASQETGKPLDMKSAQDLATAQQLVGATVLGAATQPGGGNITSTLGTVQQRTQFQQQKAAKAAEQAARAQGIIK